MCLLQEDTLLMQRASCSAYTAIRLPTTLMRARLNADIGERANVSSISAERYSDFGKQYTDYGKVGNIHFANHNTLLNLSVNTTNKVVKIRIVRNQSYLYIFFLPAVCEDSRAFC